METSSPPCPACKCSHFLYWFTKQTRFGRYKVYRCRKCRSAFIYPRPSHSELESVYSDTAFRSDGGGSAEERFTRRMESEKLYPNSTLDAARMIENCKRFSCGHRLLDVGAGYGYFTNAALARGFSVQALDPSPSSRGIFAIMNKFDPEPIMLGKDFVEANRQAFDVVILSQVLEHISNLEETLFFLDDLLTDGGVVAIAVPHFQSLVSRFQGRNDMFIIPPYHLNYFTIKGLRELFERHGFQVLMTETISRFDPRKLKRELRLGFFGVIFCTVLEAVLRVADNVNLGMYANIYFRKGRPALSDPGGRRRQS